MQDTDFKWFLENYQALFQKYGVSHLVIKDKTVLGSFPSYAEGVRAACLTEKLGSFIVQGCNGDESAYTNYIASMNFLNN